MRITIGCERNLPPDATAVQTLKTQVHDFQETMPIAEALDNDFLEEHHFK
jgi:hypothetical protein